MSDNPPVLYCANHPTVETSLRCNNCNKPICPKCAVRVPTGYRCKECVRNQQKVFDTAEWYDYPIAFGVALVLSFGGSFLARILGFFIIFLAGIGGVVIAEIVRFAVRRRRSPRLALWAAIGAILGSLPLILYTLVVGLLFGSLGGGLLNLVWLGIYVFTVTSTVYYRLRGIRIS
jgi:B-box zinc finger